MFKVAAMPILDLPPRTLYKVRAWDIGASAKGDYTVGLLLGRTYGGNPVVEWVVLDVVRLRGGPEEVRKLVTTVTAADGWGEGMDTKGPRCCGD
jgi:hypothetical protein